MHDRNVEHPNRYRMVKVEGTNDIYDIVPAPGRVDNDGTPINKATLLKDDTASRFGLSVDALPDDALRVISRFQSVLCDEYVWEKSRDTSGYEIKRKNETANNITTTGYDTEVTYFYSDSVSLDLSTGEISLVNPKSIQRERYNAQNIASAINGKYFTVTNVWGADVTEFDGVYFCNIVTARVDEYCIVSNYDVLTSEYVDSKDVLGYVNSASPDTYPPKVSDGYTYTPLGMLGEKVRIETGSYVGTGTNGENNKTSLTFNFNPKLVVVSYNGLVTTFVNGDVNAKYGNKDGDSSMRLIASWSGNIVNWYSTYTSNPSIAAMYQLNGSGNYYYYTAIG